MDKLSTVQLFDEVTKSIKYFRLRNDLAEIEKVIIENQTTEVKSKINVFGKMSNMMKDNKANKYSEKKQEVLKEISKFELENPKVNYNLYYQSRLNKCINDLFKKDSLDIIKVFYALAIIFDNDFEYTFNDESLKELSILLFTDKDMIFDIKTKFDEAYNAISGKMFSSFKLNDTTIIKEATKNALVFLETGNKKYLESNALSDSFQVMSSLLNYGLLFGLGVAPTIKLVDKSEDKFVKISVDETIILLTMVSVLIDIAYNSHKSKNFDDELLLTINTANYLRGFVLKQIVINKTDVKVNKEKLDLFNNWDNLLMSIVKA